MNKKIFQTIIIVLLIVFISKVYQFLLSTYHIELLCFFHKITGFYCPGCGITRMFLACLNGKVIQAFYYNRLLFIFIIICAPYFFYRYNNWYHGKTTKSIPQKMWIFLLIVFLCYGIMRNIDYFSYLQPIQII